MGSDSIIIILGLGVFAFFGLFLWLLKRNNPNRELGEVLTTTVINRNELIMDVAIVLLYISEAITAASVHSPESGPASNPLARLAAHLLISLLGAVFNITLIRDIATIFKPMPLGYKAVNFSIAFILLFASVLIPFANLDMIASNINAGFEMRHWFYKLFASDSDYQYFLVKYKYPENYSVWEHIPVILKVSIYVSFIHYLAMLVLGLRSLSSPARKALLFIDSEVYDKKAEDIVKGKMKEEKKEDKGDKKEDKEKKEEKKEDKKDDNALVSNAKKVLKFYGYKDEGKIATLADAVYKKLSENSAKNTETATKLAQIALEIAEYEQTSTKDTAKAAKIKADTKAVFENKDKLNIKLIGGNS